MWPFSLSKSNAITVEKAPPTRENSTEAAAAEHAGTKYPRTELTSASERLNLLFPARLPLVSGAAFVGGLIIGGAKGGYTAADRYRAENAHRLPISRSGWYLYHKSKNYHSVLGSLREGTKQGLILMGWAALFATTEEVIDRARGRLFSRSDDVRSEDEDISIHRQRDAASTVMAGLTVSGIYSWRRGFDQFGAARMAKVSLKYSLVYGLLQDTLSTFRGNPPGYVNWILGKSPWSESIQNTF